MIDFQKLTFLAKKNNKIFYSSKKKGVFPLFDCLQKHKQRMECAEIADKVVGTGAARLLVYAKIKSLYTLTITKEALQLLVAKNIKTVFKEKTENIMNQYKTGVCPVELLSRKHKSIDKFIISLKSFLNYH